MTRTAFYSGSFDPVTLGHTDVIERAARLVDRLVIGIGVHPGKAPMFDADERCALLEHAVEPIRKRTGTEIAVETFSNLAVLAAAGHGACMIIRGLRDGTDLDYEMQMAGMNGAMEPGIQTVFIPASPDMRHISGTLVRQIAKMGGDVSPFVSQDVAKRLKDKA